MSSVVSVSELNTFLQETFVQLHEGLQAIKLGDGTATIRLVNQPWMQRPGNLISGPAQFTLADTAAYATLFTKVGIVPMAVTSNININFLNPCPVGDMLAECRLIKLGRRSAICEVEIRAEGRAELASHAIVTYALPLSKGA